MHGTTPPSFHPISLDRTPRTAFTTPATPMTFNRTLSVFRNGAPKPFGERCLTNLQLNQIEHIRASTRGRFSPVTGKSVPGKGQNRTNGSVPLPYRVEDFGYSPSFDSHLAPNMTVRCRQVFGSVTGSLSHLFPAPSSFTTILSLSLHTLISRICSPV